ncbi:MAG: NADH-quinone oxidoreductase subunit H [Candidatus Omnitrophota bacterium]|jgi:formate hydrogenlyase subunit 4
MVFSILQIVLLIAIAPLVSGVITKIKNNLRLRRGASVWQPYYNLGKLFFKQEVVSEHASWLFKVAPSIVLASNLLALLLVPAFITKSSAQYLGDLLLLIFVLALGRFFLALAGLDTGSSFGAMGSSREMFVSSFTEPAVVLAFFTVSLNFGTTNLGAMSGVEAIKFSSIVAAISLLMVSLAETARIPVDNQETHLELTMIHEAMVLEYSGHSLALIELASYIKQIVFFTLITTIIYPVVFFAPITSGQVLTGIMIYLAKLSGITVLIAFIEVSLAKMRLFRAVDFLYFAFVLALLSIIVATLGA